MDYPAVAEEELLNEQGYDPNDPEQVNEARKKAGRERKQHLIFIRDKILSDPNGRKWMHRLLAECELLQLSFLERESERGTAFRDGKKFIGLQLLADARAADRDLFDKMVREGEDNKLPPLFPTNGLL